MLIVACLQKPWQHAGDGIGMSGGGEQRMRVQGGAGA